GALSSIALAMGSGLSQLTASKLTWRALAIIKEQAAVDAICFPETMCKMFIVNAPTFFTASSK
ncbi:hypothetical protein, partial [Serratia marcescens]|uniref:hypothetical protein n=1 Tax=Serratia marcescens TaxID=615 RepID=UPI001953AB5C